MIIRTRPLGGPYVKVSLFHPNVSLLQISPGHCAKVNGRYLAIADIDGDVLSFVVKENSFLLRENLTEISVPDGKQFEDQDCEVAMAVTGGTGIGAITLLAKNRISQGKHLDIIAFSRGLEEKKLLDEFPHLFNLNRMLLWNTIERNRPTNPLDPSSATRGSHVFAAGPASLIESLKQDPKNPTIHLNF